MTHGDSLFETRKNGTVYPEALNVLIIAVLCLASGCLQTDTLPEFAQNDASGAGPGDARNSSSDTSSRTETAPGGDFSPSTNQNASNPQTNATGQGTNEVDSAIDELMGLDGPERDATAEPRNPGSMTAPRVDASTPYLDRGIEDSFQPDAEIPRPIECAPTERCIPVNHRADRLFLVDFTPYTAEGHIPDWCPENTDPQPVSFYQGANTNHKCTPCTCELTEQNCAIAPLQCALGVDDCSTAQDFTAGLQSGCHTFNPPANGIISCQASASTYEGSCQANGGELIPSPPVSTQVEVCEVPEPQWCDGQTSLCIPTTHRACFLKDRLVPCPAGFERVNVADGFVDQRRCTACQCNVDQVGCDGFPSYALLRTPECSPNFGPHPRFEGECGSFEIPPADGAMWSFRSERVSATGECAVTDGQPADGVVMTENVKLCCLPPSD